MKCLKLRVHIEDRIADVFSAVKKSEAKEVLLICPRQWSVLTDASLIRRLHEENSEKTLIFVIPQKFSRDFVSQLGFAAVSACDESAPDAPQKTVSEVLTGEVFAPEAEVEEAEAPIFTSKKIEKETHRTMRRSQIFFAVLVLLISGILIAYWLRPRAIVLVKPRIEAVPVIQNIIVSLPGALTNAMNSELPQIPGIFVENNQEGIVLYESTGREYDIENARGKITIFNENPREKFFVPSRLESPDGLIFRFKSDITVPPATEDGPGQKEVEVFADPYDPDGNPVGFRGNIDAGTELHFAALPPVSRELWYAKANRGPLVGGSTLTHFFVTEEDQTLAEEFIQKKFKLDAIEELNDEVKRRSEREKIAYVLIDDDRLLQQKFSDYIFPEDKVGMESQRIDVSGKLSVAGLVFSQEEVEEVVLERLRATLDVRQRLLEIDDHSVEYRVLDSSEFKENNWVKLSVKMVGVRSLDFNSPDPGNLAWQEKMKEAMINKNKEDVKAFLVNQPEIERVINIEVFPAWRKELPDNISRIELQTAFD